MSQPASWSVLNPHSFYSRARRVRAEAEYTYWRKLRPIADIESEEDWTTVTTRLHRDTGLTKTALNRNFDALDTLDQLPRLNALVQETFLLEMHHLAIIDAVVDLLLEPATIQVNSLLYSAHDIADAPVHHPTTGVLTEEAAKTLREMVSHTLDMDEAQNADTTAHDMTFRIRCFVIGRDWVCRWPGCNRKAVHADGDHRINHKDGGPTSADNMAMLCRHHHNRKTDQQVTYLIDPVTGDVYWHFRDGTYAVDLATGPLAPRERRWVQTYAHRKGRAREYARRKATVERFEAYQARHGKSGRPPPPVPDPLSFLAWHQTSPPEEADPDPPPF